MTIAPLTPAGASVPTTGAPAGSTSAGDFLAEIVQALGAVPTEQKTAVQAGPTATLPVVQPEGATPAGKPHQRWSKPDHATDLPDVATTPTDACPPVDQDPATIPTPVATVPVVPVPVVPVPVVPVPVVPVPGLAVPVVPVPVVPATVATGSSTAPAADEPLAPNVRVSPGKHLGQNRTSTPDEHPGLHLGLDHTAHPVNPKHDSSAGNGSDSPGPKSETPKSETPKTEAPKSEAPKSLGVDLPAPAQKLEHAASPAPVVQPTTPTTLPTTLPTAVQAPLAATAAASAAPILTTSAVAPVSAPSVPDQVFGEVTGLTSRGNGTHRITMKLQPEALGEVRVVLTLRAGAVHVRLAAGDEAKAALLEGSPELKQLLERAGATETRIVVRDLPTGLVTAAQHSAHAGNQGGFEQPQQQSNAQPGQSTSQTPATDTASSQLTGGDRSPDRHAGTRADHLATDGDDTSRGLRAGGPRDVAPIRSVTGSQISAVDLTM
ncbi:MAG: flagellar hook-length control protein FliK [Marmoricola sp.]